MTGKDLFDNYEIVDIPGVGKLEAYPNRNSCSYIDVYGIHETKTMLRGTYRYPGMGERKERREGEKKKGEEREKRHERKRQVLRNGTGW